MEFTSELAEWPDVDARVKALEAHGFPGEDANHLCACLVWLEVTVQGIEYSGCKSKL